MAAVCGATSATTLWCGNDAETEPAAVECDDMSEERIERMKSWPRAVGVLEAQLEDTAAELRALLTLIPQSQPALHKIVSRRANVIAATLADLKAAHP